ncbi:MAG TPA: urease accessory protein UreD [Actinoplanes sp.]
MRAHARIAVEADRRGGTRASVLRSESPLLLRRTGPAGAGLVAFPMGAATRPPTNTGLTTHPTGAATRPPTNTGLATHPTGAAARPPTKTGLTAHPTGAAARPPTNTGLTAHPTGAAARPPADAGLTTHPMGATAGPSADSGLTVHLVGGAAGPLCGDDLRLDVEVGPGAWLDVRSVAASLALPGPPGRPPSRLSLRVTVAEGGTLRWFPEPLIAAAGCHHITSTEIRVAAGGTLVWRDELVCGRHGEDPGNAATEITVRYAGATLYRHELAVGPAAPGWCAAAVLGGCRAVGSVVVVGGAVLGGPPAVGSMVVAEADPPPAATLGDAAIMPLAGPGFVAMAVGADIRQVRAVLDPLSALAEGRIPRS